MVDREGFNTSHYAVHCNQFASSIELLKVGAKKRKRENYVEIAVLK